MQGEQFNFDSIERHKSDFTSKHYVELLRLAKKSYEFVGYGRPISSSKYVLWRHDVDLSLNRADRLAQIEHDEGVRATYFINPHCEFYNLFEKGQTQLVKHILSLGHNLGLHFDVGYYQIKNEDELDQFIAREAGLLKYLFGDEINAFSFHNPNAFILTCEKEEYGGLINCYSKFFKTSVPYCSDSNGYWRFRRLRDVLEAATDSCLQVLTHPGLWQGTVMSPRERVFRCVQGRATATMQQYDKILKLSGRSNLGSLNEQFQFLKESMGHKAEMLDYRWMRGESASLFVDLWRMFEARLTKFCRIWFSKVLRVPSVEIKALIESSTLRLPMHRVFAVICKTSWAEITGLPEAEFLAWQQVRDHIVHGRRCYPREKLENGAVFIVQIMQKLKEFDQTQPVGKDGLSNTGTTGSPASRVHKGVGFSWLSENRKLLGLSKKVLQEFDDSNSAGAGSSN